MARFLTCAAIRLDTSGAVYLNAGVDSSQHDYTKEKIFGFNQLTFRFQF